MIRHNCHIKSNPMFHSSTVFSKKMKGQTIVPPFFYITTQNRKAFQIAETKKNLLRGCEANVYAYVHICMYSCYSVE